MVWVQLRDPASVNKVLSSQRRLLTATMGLHIHVYTNAWSLCLPEHRCVNVHPFTHVYTHLYTRSAHLNIDMWVSTHLRTLCLPEHMCVCVNVHPSPSSHVYTHLHAHSAHLHMLMWVCISPHTCIHICMHTLLSWTYICKCAPLHTQIKMCFTSYELNLISRN